MANEHEVQLTIRTVDETRPGFDSAIAGAKSAQAALEGIVGAASVAASGIKFAADAMERLGVFAEAAQAHLKSVATDTGAAAVGIQHTAVVAEQAFEGMEAMAKRLHASMTEALGVDASGMLDTIERVSRKMAQAANDAVARTALAGNKVLDPTQSAVTTQAIHDYMASEHDKIKIQEEKDAARLDVARLREQEQLRAQVEKDVEIAMAAGRARRRAVADADEAIVADRMASSSRVAQIQQQGTEQQIMQGHRASEELIKFDEQLADAAQRMAERRSAIETNLTQKVSQAATQRRQAEERADQAYFATVERNTARMDAVAARSEGVRLQSGGRGAPRRLEYLIETEKQMTDQIANAERQRTNIHQEAALNEARIVMQGAQHAVEALREAGGARTAAMRRAKQTELEATQQFESLQTDAVARGEAERTAIMENAQHAQAKIQANQGAERLAAAAGGAGGSGGGGLTGLLGGFAGGFGGAGGIGGGLLNLGKTALGGLFEGLKGVAGGVWEALGAGMNVLMAPVKLLGEGFKGIMSAAGDAAGSITHMIGLAAGLYGIYQVVTTIQGAISGLAHGMVEFQDVMVRAASLTSQNAESATEFGTRMRDASAGVVQVSMETGRSAVELGNAMYFIESHGIAGAKAMDLLRGSAQLATAGLGDTDKIVRVVAGQMLAYGEDTKQAGEFTEAARHYFDVFAKTVQVSSVSADEVASTFARITPLAAALHIPVTEVGADFATISQTGLSASRVMTDLIAVFNQFLQGSDKQVAALKNMGLTLGQVRETLSTKGLIAAAEQIWTASGRDIAAVSQVFGDRARALVGYLALVEDGGRRAESNLKKLNEASVGAGATAQVFETAMLRLSVQWQRFQAILQGAAIVIGSIANDSLGSLAAGLSKVNDSMQNADFTGAAKNIGALFDQVATTALSVLDDLGTRMFGAGFKLMEELAKGIYDGLSNAINAAVNAVADFIASFLLGNSPPIAGPLSYIKQGVANWTSAYADATRDNGQVMASAAANVATQVNEELGKIGTISRAGYTEAYVKQKIADIDAQLLPWKDAAQDIKDRYQDMLRPLDMQIEQIKRIKDLEYERSQLAFKQRDYELDMLKLRAEGDPVKRAQLAGQIARQQEISEQHSINAQIAALARREREMGRSRMSPAERAAERIQIADERAMLNLRRQEHALRNPALLGQYAEQKAALDFDKQGAGLKHSAFELQRDITLQPLLEQHDKIQVQMKEELSIIEDHVRVLEQERHKWEAIEKQITAAKAAAGKGGAAEPWIMDAAHELGAGMSTGINTAIGKMAQEMTARFKRGFDDFTREWGPSIGASLAGAIVGGMFGPAGMLAGAILGPKLLTALTERGVTADDFGKWAHNVSESISQAFRNVMKPLMAGDLFGAADAMGASIREWVEDVKVAMFKEWQTAPNLVPANMENSGGSDPTGFMVSGVKRAPIEQIMDETGLPTGRSKTTDASWTRRTGLGRTIIEGMFGQQDAELNYTRAYTLLDENIFKPVTRAITDLYTKIFVDKPIFSGMGVSAQTGEVQAVYVSQAEAIGRGILNMIQGAFAWVDKQASLIKSAGETLSNVVLGGLTFMTSDPQAQKTLGDGVHALGVSVASSFFSGLLNPPMSALAAVFAKGPNVQLGGKAREAIGPENVDTAAKTALDTGKALAAADHASSVVEGKFEAGVLQFIKNGLGFGEGPGFAAQLVNIGQAIVQGIASGQASDKAKELLAGAAIAVAVNVINALKSYNAFNIGSPSKATEVIGVNVVEGLNAGIESAAPTTGAIVRSWVNDQVIDQARAILLSGAGAGAIEPGSSVGGARGGLGSIAHEAVQSMSSAFVVSATFTTALTAFGRAIVTGIMDPITDSRGGLLARMSTVLDALKTQATTAGHITVPSPVVSAPAVPAAPAPIDIPETVPVNPRPYYASGTDFVVGAHGTDTEFRSMWLTPGERVQVTPQGQAGNGGSSQGVNLTVHVNVQGNGNADDIEEAAYRGAQRALDEAGQHMPDQMVDTWRTTVGQTNYVPSGVQSRRSRG